MLQAEKLPNFHSEDEMAGDADRADPLRKDTVEEIAPTPYVDVSNVVGVIRLGYGSAARHLLRLLVPAVVLFLPEGVVLGGLIVTTIGRDGLIANGGLEPLSVSSGLAVETIAALLVGLVTYVIALAAMVVMSSRPAAGAAGTSWRGVARGGRAAGRARGSRRTGGHARRAELRRQ